MSIGERIKEAALRVGGQSSLVRRLGISRGALANYISGATSPQIETVELIAKASGVDLVWLLTGQDIPGEKKTYHLTGFAEDYEIPPASYISIPRYDIQASAGYGAFADGQEVVDYLNVPRAWLNRYVSGDAHVVVIEARGDSMEPTIDHGDLLMVQMKVEREDVAAGGVFVFTVDGMIVVKRLQVMLGGDLKISADNRAYEPETVPAAERDDKIIVHGRVFWTGGPLVSR